MEGSERCRYKLGDDDFRVSYAMVVKVRISAGPETASEHEMGRLLLSDEEDLEAEMVLDAYMSVRNSMAAIRKALQEWRESNLALELDEVVARG